MSSATKSYDRQQVWKRNMFFTLKDCQVNISTIRRLIRENTFNVNAEIGPIAKEEFGTKKAPRYHTALTFASWKGDLNLVKCLVEENANPDAFTSQGLAAIHCCCMQSGSNNLAVIKYFLDHSKHKFDINVGNKRDGTTPLMYACSFGLYDIAEFLLQKHAAVNHQDNEGKSALFHAVRRGHLNLVKLLVEYNACIYLCDNNNGSVLHHLVDVFRSSSMTGVRLFRILSYLVDVKGLSVSYQTRSGSTVLHEACRRGLTKVVSYLLNRGANVETVRNGWETPVWTLVMGICPRPQLIALMLEKGANFELKNCLGMTLLQYAKQVAKNAQLIAALENAQKTVRTKRMNVLLARRKQILSFATSELSNKDDSKSLSLTSKLGLKETVQDRLDNKRKDRIIATKTKLCDQCDHDNLQSQPDRDESYSIISGRTVTMQNTKLDDGNGTNDDSNSSEENEHSEWCKNDIKDSVSLHKQEINGNGNAYNCDHSNRESSTICTYNCDGNNFSGNLTFHRLNQNDADSDNLNDCACICSDDSTTHDANVVAASPSLLNNDVDSCFDRLLQKKRLLEETNHQNSSSDSDPDDEENKGQQEMMETAPKPQKIKCVRRSAVSLSDSE